MGKSSRQSNKNRHIHNKTNNNTSNNKQKNSSNNETNFLLGAILIGMLHNNIENKKRHSSYSNHRILQNEEQCYVEQNYFLECLKNNKEDFDVCIGMENLYNECYDKYYSSILENDELKD